MLASSFDSYLDEQLVPACDQLSRRAKRAATLAARLVKAAAVGDARVVEVTLRDLEAIPLDEPLQASLQAASAFDTREYMNTGFAADLAAACREAGIPLEQYFPNYFVFPFPVRVDVENLSVIVNRKRIGTLRASALVAAIGDERERLERSPFNAAEFISVLFGIWERMNVKQSAKKNLQFTQPQPLKHVYKELVPFARWRREYPESFFAYDVQRLLLSGVTDCNGSRVAFDRGRQAANALRLVDRNGQERLIATVDFVEAR